MRKLLRIAQDSANAAWPPTLVWGAECRRTNLRHDFVLPAAAYFCFCLLLLVAACFVLLPDDDAGWRRIAPQRRYLLRCNKMMPTLSWSAGYFDAFAKEGVT